MQPEQLALFVRAAAESNFSQAECSAGRRLFREGHVLSCSPDGSDLHCRVDDGDGVFVLLLPPADGTGLPHCSCGTPACRHLYAVYLYLEERAAFLTPRTPPGALAFFQDQCRFQAPDTGIRPSLRLVLDVRELSLQQPVCTVGLRLGGMDPFLIPDLAAFLQAWESGTACYLREDVQYQPHTWTFSPIEEGLLALLLESLPPEAREGGGRFLPVPLEQLPVLLDLLRGSRILLRQGSAPAEPCLVEGAQAGLRCTLQDSGGGAMELQVHLAWGEQSLPLHSARLLPGIRSWALIPGGLIQVAQESLALVWRIQGALVGPARFMVGQEDADQALEELVPYLEVRGQVCLEGKLARALRPPRRPPRPVVRFDYGEQGLEAELLFRYGNQRIPWNRPGQLVRSGEYAWIIREPQAEERALAVLQQAGFREGEGGVLRLSGEEAQFRFIYQHLPGLQEQWDILYNSRFRPVSRVLPRPRVRLRYLRKQNFLELKVTSQDRQMRIDPRAVLDAARRGKSYVRLENGEFLPLAEEQQALLATLAREVGFVRPELGTEDSLHADPGFIPLISRALDEAGEGALQVDRSLHEFAAHLVAWEKDLSPPSDLRARLRRYQREGFSWLYNLYRNRLGGILADDMGLGKTVQTIAFLLKAVETGEKRPFLVVCPSSLLFNWEAEIHRFAPGLQTCALGGDPGQRSMLLGQMGKGCVGLVSYALLQRDQQQLSELEYAAVILDEAQHIKNPASGRTLSAKSLQAGSCFALTGTPLENSLAELWSLFDFVLPGYLFTFGRFRREYVRPLGEGADRDILTRLQQRTAPFMLRRNKEQVLTQLPAKGEQVCFSELLPRQREAYLSVLAFFDLRLLPLLERDGVERHSIELLAALTRLRQICCHPGLALERYRDADSGKLELLLEILNQALDGGHKSLIFSQFTGMLDLIGARLREQEIPFLRLDGGTAVAKRGPLVRQFNEDGGVACFLISLKAGGTGLNLTAADTVIHVDPWWNPAVEDQASARAHRMGQTRPVNVYKLIARGSVEEKILSLQRDKQRLFNAVVEGGTANLSRLGLDQIRSLFRSDES